MNESLTTAAPISSSVTAYESTSIFTASGDFDGLVQLQLQPTGSADWHNVISVSSKAAVVVVTPDPAINYRVKAALKSGTAEVFFGASVAV